MNCRYRGKSNNVDDLGLISDSENIFGKSAQTESTCVLSALSVDAAFHRKPISPCSIKTLYARQQLAGGGGERAGEGVADLPLQGVVGKS